MIADWSNMIADLGNIYDLGNMHQD